MSETEGDQSLDRERSGSERHLPPSEPALDADELTDTPKGVPTAAEQPPPPLPSAPPWAVPEPLGYVRAIEGFYGLAAPLLAGFSMTLVAIVVTDRQAFVAPDAVLSLAMVAVGALIFALQLGMWATQHAAPPGDYLDWYPMARLDDQALHELRRKQLNDHAAWEFYREWASKLYRLGILVFLAAGMIAVLPEETPRLIEESFLTAVIAPLIGLGWLLLEAWWIAARRLGLRPPFDAPTQEQEPGAVPRGFGPGALR